MKRTLILLLAACGVITLNAATQGDAPLWLRYPAVSPDGQTIAFTDTFRIERLTADSLVLTKGTQPFAYGRAAGQE